METETGTPHSEATLPVDSFTNGLRALADALEADARVASQTDRLPYLGPLRTHLRDLTAWYLDTEQDRMVAAMRALKQVGFQITKDFSTSYAKFVCVYPCTPAWDSVTVTLYISRKSVCTPKVIGQEEKTVRKIVKEAEFAEVRELVDVVEWDCHPMVDLD